VENKNIKIVYFGSDMFSAQVLAGILLHPVEVVGIVTLPDKLTKVRGGKVIKTTPFSEHKWKPDIKILQPTNLLSSEFLSELRSLGANLFMVLSYKILPKEVWGMPEYGTINLHPSLLPRHRGAAPLEWTIMSRDRECGVSTFFIDDTLDQGRLIGQSILMDRRQDRPLDPTELRLTLNMLGAKLCNECVSAAIRTIYMIKKYGKDTPEFKPLVGPCRSSYAKKITSENSRLDWTTSAQTLDAQLRGLIKFLDRESSRAWTTFRGKRINLTIRSDSRPFKTRESHVPGQFSSNGRNLLVALSERTAIEIWLVQPEGKKRMPAIDWWNGIQRKEDTPLLFI